MRARVTSERSLYGPGQSRFARYLERREQQRPDPVARELRRRLLAGMRGRVIEVGCGDGRAFELYPPGVEHVLAIERDPLAREAALERAAAAPVPVDVVDGDAGALPAADGAFDGAVMVWVLCSVSNPAGALSEVRRVLAPGGELRFYEHVRSRHPVFRAVQRAGDALFWTRALGGCRTARDTVSAIRSAGFDILELTRGFHSSSLLTITSAPHVIGRARPAGVAPPRPASLA
jgi:SAM-dependent methyltransferase